VTRRDEITLCLKNIRAQFSDSEIIGKIVDCKLNLLYGIPTTPTATATTPTTGASKTSTSPSTATGTNAPKNDVSPCEQELSK